MTKEFLGLAEKMAGVFFGTSKLSVILEIPEEDIRLAIDAPDSPLGRAIRRGRLLREAEVRESVIKLALQGSGPAQAEALRLIKSID